MKVLQLPFTYRPDPVGGTEVYVEALALELRDRYSIESVICAPAAEAARYDSSGIAVERFAMQKGALGAEYTYTGDATAAANLGAIIDRERPDMVHLHALTPAVSMLVASEVKRRRLPLVFTYHTPTVTCVRGTLMRWGRIPCDGLMLVHRCASCTLHSLGLSRPAASLVGHLPTGLGRALAREATSGGGWTALRMPRLVEQRHESVRGVLELADAIVAPSQWVIEVLRANGVAPAKIVFSRQGLAAQPPVATARPEAGKDLRVGFFGRWDPSKGIHILVEALAAIPQAPITLDLYAVSAPATEYQRRARAIIEGDARIHLRDPVPANAVVRQMAGYDLIAIPSQWLETGPLVLLEAFAAGVPVIASGLGGITERVADGRDGLLVSALDPQAWARALSRLAADRSAVEALRHGVRPPRTMEDVAADMRDLYSRLAPTMR